MWSKPDLDVADEIVDKDYDPDWVHIDAVGPAQIKHEIKYFRSVFPDLQYEIIEINGEEDKVWIRYRARGTQKGNAWGFEATGKEVEFEGATILYVNSEGKIVDRWGAFCFYDPPLWDLSKKLI
jgi:predicted ester cyclase